MAKARSVSDMLSGMLSRGWTKQQIAHRTGMTVRAQTDALAGRRPGGKYAEAVRDAARAGGGRPPAPGRPVGKVKSAPGPREVTETPAGRHVKSNRTTDPALLRAELRKAKGSQVRLTVTGTGVRPGSRSPLRKVQGGHEFSLYRHGISGQALLDRIDNPREGDTWRAGDVYGALAGIAKQSGQVSDIRQVTGVEFTAASD